MKKSQLSLFEETKFTPTQKEFKVETHKAAGFILSSKKKSSGRKSRADGIYLPEDDKVARKVLGFQFPSKRQSYPAWAFPKISLRRDDVVDIILNNAEIGLDFEFNPRTKYVSIVGVATKDLAASCKYDKEIGKLLINATQRGSKFIGHFVLGADKPVLENDLGCKTSLVAWEDSMIAHYLCAAQLCKAPGKEADSEGALGFNSLGFAAHLWTNLPQWKTCRGLYCEGPCPSHSVFEYNAVDAWAGLEVFYRCKQFMLEHGIPWRVYEEHKELALDFCLAAEERGICVDLAFANRLAVEFERKKAALFPQRDGKHERFNPRSNQQVLAYFHNHDIILKANDKKSVENLLEERLFEYGFSSIGEVDSPDALSIGDRALLDLYQYKSVGKGVDAWVDEKYILDGKVHPRFVFTGASTMRLSSSRPNMQNIPAHGWGKDVKKMFVPPKGKKFISADASQLELRIVLYEAGIDPRDIQGDAFSWLVSKSPEAFAKAAEMMNSTPRQMAKTITHASNYLAGIKLYEPYEIGTPYVQKQIREGALLVFEDWIYCNKIVTFTGVRLAEILFRINRKTPKDKVLEARRNALLLQKDYFNNWPIREWHRRILKQAEQGFTQTRWGSYLRLTESDVENAKIAAAKIGQGEGAEYVQGKQIEVLREICNTDVTMDAQVHDEILLSVPQDWSNAKLAQYIELLHSESHRLPGFVSGWKAKQGGNWGEMEEIKL